MGSEGDGLQRGLSKCSVVVFALLVTTLLESRSTEEGQTCASGRVSRHGYSLEAHHHITYARMQ